jgi:hypothetical protein
VSVSGSARFRPRGDAGRPQALRACAPGWVLERQTNAASRLPEHQTKAASRLPGHQTGTASRICLNTRQRRPAACLNTRQRRPAACLNTRQRRPAACLNTRQRRPAACLDTRKRAGPSHAARGSTASPRWDHGERWHAVIAGRSTRPSCSTRLPRPKLPRLSVDTPPAPCPHPPPP